MKDIGGYNDFPPFTKEITAEDFRNEFFTWCLKKGESRQVYPNKERARCQQPYITCKVFSIDYRDCENLGFIIADDRTSGQLRYYRFGSDKDWNDFIRGVVAQFTHDNS